MQIGPKSGGLHAQTEYLSAPLKGQPNAFELHKTPFSVPGNQIIFSIKAK